MAKRFRDDDFRCSPRPVNGWKITTDVLDLPFCKTDLGANEAREHFPVGWRLAWDFVSMSFGWLDRRVAAPIMKERINDGSDKDFDYADKHWGESEIDRHHLREIRRRLSW